MHMPRFVVMFGIIFTCVSTIVSQEIPGDVTLSQKKSLPPLAVGIWTFVDAKTDDPFFREAFKNHRMHELRVTEDRLQWESDGRSDATEGEILRIKSLSEDRRWEVDFKVKWKGEPLVRYGILEVKNDRLRICFNTIEPPDEARRPLDFDLEKPSSGNVVFEYDRKK